MEKIRIEKINKSVLREKHDGTEIVFHYFYGQIYELNGSEITRDVVFLFDNSGKHVSIRDKDVPLIFELYDTDYSINQIQTGAELKVVAHKMVKNEETQNAYALLPVK